MSPSPASSASPKPRILYVDMAYTFDMIVTRELRQFLESRECGGYFEHVWSVHPIADVPTKREPAYEGFRVSTEQLSERITVIEGSSRYFPLLRSVPPVNVVVSQTRLVLFLAGLVKKENISAVCVTDPHLGGLIGLGIRALTGVPVVVWVLGNYDEIFNATGLPAMPRLFRKRWVEKIVERFVFRSVDVVAGANQNNLEFALRNGADPATSTIFLNGAIINRPHLVDPASRPRDPWLESLGPRKHFICVGRLTEVKHPDDAVRAFAVAAAADPDCDLLMAGDGRMQAELGNLAEQLGVGNRVHFLGNVPQSRLSHLLAGCFCAFSPLTGQALTEAALAGLPIVAYDRDWQKEFVEGSGSGIVVPFRDWDAMGRAAIVLLKDPKRVERTGAAARLKGLDFCDHTKVFAHEQEVYGRLLGRAYRRCSARQRT